MLVNFDVKQNAWCICFLQTFGFSLHKTLIICWTGVVWIVMFLSADLILAAPIHYKGSIGEQVM